MKFIQTPQTDTKNIGAIQFEEFLNAKVMQIEKYFMVETKDSSPDNDPVLEELFGVSFNDASDIVRRDISNLVHYIKGSNKGVQQAFLYEHSDLAIEFFEKCMSKDKEQINKMLDTASGDEIHTYHNMMIYSMCFAAIFRDYNAIEFFFKEIPSFNESTYSSYNDCLTLVSLFSIMNAATSLDRTIVGELENIITFLVTKGANINQMITDHDHQYYTSIFFQMIDAKFYFEDDLKQNQANKDLGHLDDEAYDALYFADKMNPMSGLKIDLLFSEDFLISMLNHIEDVNTKHYAVLTECKDSSLRMIQPTQGSASFLMNAIETRRIKLAKALIDRGADINYSFKNIQGMNSIAQAAAEVGLEYLELLLQSGESINDFDAVYNSMISMVDRKRSYTVDNPGVCFFYEDNVLISMMKYIKDINISSCKAPYHLASIEYHLDYEDQMHDNTMLINAIISKRLNLVRELIKRGADINASIHYPGYNKTVLDYASDAGIEYIQLLVDSDQYLEDFDNRYYHMIRSCNYSNDPTDNYYTYSDEFLISALKKVKNINHNYYFTAIQTIHDGTQEEYQYPADSLLITAITNYRIKLVEALLKNGAEVDFVIDDNSYQRSVIRTAFASGSEYIKLIFENTPKSISKDLLFIQMIQKCVWSQDYNAKLLIELIPYVNVDSELPYDTDSLLITAIQCNQFEITEALVAHGASINKPSIGQLGIRLPIIEAACAGPEYLKALLLSSQSLDLKCYDIDEDGFLMSAYVDVNHINGQRQIKVWKLCNRNIEDIVTMMQEQIKFESHVNGYFAFLKDSEFINIHLLMSQHAESKTMPAKHMIKCMRSYAQSTIPQNIMGYFNAFDRSLKVDLWKIMEAKVSDNMLKAFGVCKEGIMYLPEKITEVDEVNNGLNTIFQDHTYAICLPNEVWSHIGFYALDDLKFEMDLLGEEAQRF